MFLTGTGFRPLGREKRAERATNHPSQHTFRNKRLEGESAMILFLGLRTEEPEELRHRNRSLKGRADTGRKEKLPGQIVVFALHKRGLSSAKNANSDAKLSPAVARRALRADRLA